MLEAAREAGVGRVVLASSNHAVGFRRVADAGEDGLPADSSPRPDTYYGVSKAAIEALGSLYHSRFGMDVIAVRIGSCFETPLPLGLRGLTTWLSPDDGARLFEACLAAPSPGYRLIWGVSDNTRRVYSLAEAEALGYRSEDDAEIYADQMSELARRRGSRPRWSAVASAPRRSGRPTRSRPAARPAVRAARTPAAPAAGRRRAPTPRCRRRGPCARPGHRGVEELAGEQPRLGRGQQHRDLLGLAALALVDGGREHRLDVAHPAGREVGQPLGAATNARGPVAVRTTTPASPL